MWVDSLNGGNNKKKKTSNVDQTNIRIFFLLIAPKCLPLAVASHVNSCWASYVMTEMRFTWPHFPVSGGLSYYFINRNVISWLQWPQTKEQNNCTQPRPTSPFWEKQELFLCSAITHEFSPWIFHVIVSIEQFLFQLVRWSNMNLSCFVNQFNLVLLILLSLLFPF